MEKSSETTTTNNNKKPIHTNKQTLRVCLRLETIYLMCPATWMVGFHSASVVEDKRY